MKHFNRTSSLLIAILGFVGVGVCTAALVLLGLLGARLTRANQEVFAGIDKTMAAVRGRVQGAQQRIQASKINADDIEQRVKSFAAKEVGERIALRPEVQAGTERLVLALEKADAWMASSEDALRGVQQALAMGRSVGAPIDAKFLDELLAQLNAIRREVSQTTDAVHGIVLHLTDEEGLEERIDEAVRLVLRVVATLSELDSRLGHFTERIADAQTKVQHLKSETHSYIVIAAIGGFLFSIWMMAGQVSLGRRGWKSFFSSRLDDAAVDPVRGSKG